METQESSKKKGHSWSYLALGVVIGVVLTAGLVKAVMPSMMLVTEESRLGFDETVAALEAAIPAHGWVSPGTKNLAESIRKSGVEFSSRVKLVELCKPEYAHAVLESNPDMSSMMPCRFAVWEDSDGKVYVSKMNTGLMARLFGGVVADVMGGSVARDEHAMLEAVIKG